MDDNFFLAPIAAQTLAAHSEIADCSRFTRKFGLTLTERQVDMLASKRFEALRNNGRVEFGGGIMPKLIHALCDSPFVIGANWADTLAEMQDIFYYFKNESDDAISDDELVEYLRKIFNFTAQGSTQYIAGLSVSELEELSHAGDDDTRYVDGFGRMNGEGDV